MADRAKKGRQAKMAAVGAKISLCRSLELNFQRRLRFKDKNINLAEMELQMRICISYGTINLAYFDLRFLKFAAA